MKELDKQRIADAIKVILAILPNRDANLQTVLDLAMKDIPIYTVCHNCALRELSRLIRLCPRCFGTFRKAEFWRLLFDYLSPDEALEVYLQGFPPALTEAQKQSIENYLFELDFSPASVNRGLARFGRRTSAKKFSHPRVGFVR